MQKLRNILLVDDDNISSWLNQAMLERTALVDHVESIFDGQSAINYLKKCCSDDLDDDTPSCPDLVLLDLDMPVVNGYDVLEALKQSKDCAWLISDRVVVLTTSINPKDLERANGYDIHDFLIKPLTETKIKGLLERFLSRYENNAAPDHKAENNNQHTTDRDPAVKPANSATQENKNKEA